MQASGKIEKNIQESLPQLFQDHLMCAGVNVWNQGACQGDSGGPLMYKDDDSRKYIQIATVRGGVGDCGDDEYPGIFVRVDHPSIWDFISSTMKGKSLICLNYKDQLHDYLSNTLVPKIIEYLFCFSICQTQTPISIFLPTQNLEFSFFKLFLFNET
jgi:hypothetical protein